MHSVFPLFLVYYTVSTITMYSDVYVLHLVCVSPIEFGTSLAMLRKSIFTTFKKTYIFNSHA